MYEQEFIRKGQGRHYRVQPYYLTLYVACGLGVGSFGQDHCQEFCCYINTVALHLAFGLRYLISYQ